MAAFFGHGPSNRFPVLPRTETELIMPHANNVLFWLVSIPHIQAILITIHADTVPIRSGST